mmetsp:Transcript_38312/g.96378  ORF Transcript_38312/g.96378 Transcript_38312/m.96378 type:complete len:713 (+) Transcript_38312:90-2228(+)
MNEFFPSVSLTNAFVFCGLSRNAATLDPARQLNVVVDKLSGEAVAARYLTRSFGTPARWLCAGDAYLSSSVDEWLSVTAETVFNNVPALLRQMVAFDDHLQMRTFVVGHAMTLADLNLWSMITTNLNVYKANKQHFPHVDRLYNFLADEPILAKLGRQYATTTAQAAEPKKQKEKKSSFVPLKNNPVMGKVMTRFPPEPSGYLHIGHAKALVLNAFYADQYKGQLRIRFDDTNPSKEKVEFEESILEDLATMGIEVDKKFHSYTSQHFDTILKYCDTLIREGKAFCDSQSQEVQKEQRYKREPSPLRDTPVEENLRLWDLMQKGEGEGLNCVVRLKIDPSNNNGSLRDPAIYRCVVDTPHNRTGDKYKVYPLYDFACPIVDSVEGVTHALRSQEYHEHNPLYEFVLQLLKLRFVQIEDFSRLNFQYALLSKRKLQWFVDEGYVSGWDSPAFPTIRGMIRRGLTVAALKSFMTDQGSSKSEVNMDMKHLWARNRTQIDPVAPRHMAVEDEFKVKLTLTNGPSTAAAVVVAKHPKNKDLGEHALVIADQLWLEGEDAALISENEEITLMGWGNCVVKKIERDGDRVAALTGEFNPEGDFKSTKLKVAWVPDVPDAVPVEVQEFDVLITKSKLEKEDKFEDFVNKKIVYSSMYLGSPTLRTAPKGETLQLQRRGYFKVDSALQEGKDSKAAVLIHVPDGHGKYVLSTAFSRAKGL